MRDFSINKVLEYFEPDCGIASIMDNYRVRTEQVHLARAVTEAFITDEFLVAEAGTGVGKTLAYLIPAIEWAAATGEKVVISTRTKALQQQLIEKDIPALQRLMNYKFTCMEAKGRENYLCWNKYINILSGKRNLDEQETRFMENVFRWAEDTGTGDRKELALDSRQMQHWMILAADRRSCAREMCRYSDKCFRLKMLKGLQKADIIIVNHALLLADIMVDNSILPEYHRLIIDEAHTFDRESFDKLSCRLSVQEIYDILRFLYNHDQKYARGYLQHLKVAYPDASASLEELSGLIDRLLHLTSGFFGGLNRAEPDDKGYQSSRVIKEDEMEKGWVLDSLENYLAWQYSTNLLINKLLALKDSLTAGEEEPELSQAIFSLREISDAAFQIMEEDFDKQDRIVWLEYERDKVKSIISSRTGIGEVLEKSLYNKLDSLVMISATLAVGDNFEHFIEKCGLLETYRQGRVTTFLEDSPFFYQQQACLITLNDIASPDDINFNQEVSDILKKVFTVITGGILVLFTARKQMQEVAQMLRNEAGKKLLVQYEDGEFGHLLDEFISSPHAVLMGLETFWEGIDLKGDLLKCVVIVKLPFRSPADPFCSAWDKYYRLRQKNSFQHFLLPDAALRFKQGTGRLIRGENDRGVIVVLDNRLDKKNYGSVFKNCVPIKNLIKITKNELAAEIKPWI